MARGSQVFDVLRVEITADGPCAIGLRPHVARFLRSAELMGMADLHEVAVLEKAVAETVMVNRSAAPESTEPWVVKLIAAWVDEGIGVLPSSLRPVVFVVVWPLPDDAASVVSPPISLHSSAMPKIPASIMPPSLKVAAAYTPAIRQQLQARAAGFDYPIFRTESGDLAESTSLSALVITNGRMLAPPLDSVLDGISRRTILDVAQALSIPVEVRPIRWDEVTEANELFLASTNNAVAPVARLDERTLEAPGPVTDRIGQVMTDLYAGRHPLSERWLTPLAPLAG